MSSKPVTLIASDFHMGGGDSGDDFVYQNGQFVELLRQQGESSEGKRGRIELILNGDFLELAQVTPQAYNGSSARYWCSEAESLRNLEVVLKGHADVFEQLRRFRKAGNRVTLFAGNHDVELYWGKVRDRLQEAAGPLEFELGQEWYERYDGRLRIAHGHMLDPANRFEHWDNPILLAEYGEMRMEMCPGTLFMVKFVNSLEEKYPFSDNISRGTLARVLAQEDRFGFAAAAWLLARFAARHPGAALEMRKGPDIARQLLNAVRTDPFFGSALTELYRRVRADPEADLAKVREKLRTEDSLAEFLADAIAKVPAEEWLGVIDLASPATLGDSGQTLGIGRAGLWKDKEECRKAAREQWERGNAAVVVLGHTHKPDEVRDGSRSYFNPGSWTRFADEGEEANLTLERLKREEDFRYELNYVRVEQSGAELLSAMVCHERSAH